MSEYNHHPHNFIFTKKNNPLHYKLQGFYRQKDEKFDQFFDEITTEYKLLKKLTHECQMNCFGKAEFTRKESEACARSCLDPYLQVRKAIADQMGTCDKAFQFGEAKCLASDDMNFCYSTLIGQLGTCIQQNTDFAKDQYKSVLSQFLKQ